MAQHFNRDKRRIEESRKKRREEKRLVKLQKKNAALAPPAEGQTPAETPAENSTQEVSS